MIEKGKFTKAELVAKVAKTYPDYKPVTLNTLLYDSKNEKYNRFPKLVAVSKEGVYGFKAAK